MIKYENVTENYILQSSNDLINWELFKTDVDNNSEILIEPKKKTFFRLKEN